MPLNVVVGTAEKACVKIEVTKGSQKRATRIEAYDGSAWKLVQSFAPPMSLSVTPSVTGAYNGSSPGLISITSSTATATPVGGTGPFTYAWTHLSGDTLTVTNPNNASTAFRASIGPGDSWSATYRCTATDSLGTTALGSVDITLSNNSGA
ncbi:MULTISPECIES: hypothetical protein [Alphaproteobacteria]|uniref:hypothetical protein n=1 Tax=Sphingopyxis sp. TaxID=1908224 RepID=UPI004034EDD6